MRRTAPFLLAVLAAACGGPPTIRPATPAEHDSLLAQCRTTWAPGDWRVVHAIHSTLPDGSPGAFVGVTAAENGGRTSRSVLLSLEGLVLLDASWTASGVVVARALPPLDAAGFADGMVADVRLILFPPPGRPAAVGTTDGGDVACRWVDDDGDFVDVTLAPSGERRVVSWSADGTMQREARLGAAMRGPFAEHVELVAHGTGGYSLELELLETE
jgi:hypothetical protein